MCSKSRAAISVEFFCTLAFISVHICGNAPHTQATASRTRPTSQQLSSQYQTEQERRRSPRARHQKQRHHSRAPSRSVKVRAWRQDGANRPTFPLPNRRENNRTSLSSHTAGSVGHGPCCGTVVVVLIIFTRKFERVASRFGYERAVVIVVIILVECCCCYSCCGWWCFNSAVVAPKCPPPPTYMFMFRSRRATLTKRLTKAAARKRRILGGGAAEPVAAAAASVAHHHLEILLRQLQENQLEMLLRAVERDGNDCVLVQKEWTPPPSSSRPLPPQPHVLCCQLWRWPDVRHANELRRMPNCKSARDPVYVCCNPYHWSRLCLPGMCKECVVYMCVCLAHLRKFVFCVCVFFCYCLRTANGFRMSL